MLSQSVTQFSVFVRDLTHSYDHLQIVIRPQTRPLFRFWTKMWMGFLVFEPPIPKTLTHTGERNVRCDGVI